MKQSIIQVLPKKSEFISLFWVVLLGSNVLSFFGFIYNISAFILKYTLWEILIILAYVLSFALIESCLIIFIVLVISIILPSKWLRDYFLVHGTMIYIFATLLLLPWLNFTNVHGFNDFYHPLESASNRMLFIIFWIFLAILIFFFVGKLVRAKGNRLRIKLLIERIEILSILFFSLDILSISLVLSRLLK